MQNHEYWSDSHGKKWRGVLFQWRSGAGNDRTSSERENSTAYRNRLPVKKKKRSQARARKKDYTALRCRKSVDDTNQWEAPVISPEKKDLIQKTKAKEESQQERNGLKKVKAANIEHRIISIEVQNGTRGMEEFLGFVSYHRSYWNTAQGVKLAYPKWEKITNEDEKDTTHCHQWCSKRGGQ